MQKDKICQETKEGEDFSIEDSVNASILGLEDYITKNK